MLTRTEQHVRDARLYAEGKLVISKNLEAIDISDGIDWEYNHGTSSKTYQVYLHSMPILKSLIMASMNQKDTTYLKMAKELIILWDSEEHNLKSTQAWHEHAVSSRLNNIIYFQERAKEFKLDDEVFQNILLKHCDFLSVKKNYMENNHGIMMDNALISAAKRINDKQLRSRYMETAYYRVKMAFLRDFSKMGVHLENSPEYHKMVLSMIKNVSANLNSNGYSLGRNFAAFMTRAVSYSKSVIKPNGELPIVGDSSLYKEKLEKSYGDFVDHEAGVIITQFRNKEEGIKSSWMLFKSGYRSLTHKHKDDLSLSLYVNGHDLLVDSGKYSYNLKDPIRSYIVSPKAHSTVYLKDSEYKYNNPYSDQIKLKTTRFVTRGNYKVNAGINNLYPGVHISRYIVLSNENLLVVYDNIVSKDEHEAIQNFVLPENAKVEKIDSNTFEVTIEDKIYIFQNHIIDNNVMAGSIENGYLSYKFNSYVENKRIEFSKKGNKMSLITTVYEKSLDLKLNDFKADRQRIKFTQNSEKKEFLL